MDDGTNLDKIEPTLIDSSSEWIQVSASFQHSHGIKKDGTLWSWGTNKFGVLGVSSDEDENTPVQIGEDTMWQTVQGGWIHCMAIKQDGTLWGWGDNLARQLGTGDNIGSQTPIQIGMDKWISINLGNQFSLGSKTDGTIWSWGEGILGQLVLQALNTYTFKLVNLSLIFVNQPLP